MLLEEADILTQVGCAFGGMDKLFAKSRLLLITTSTLKHSYYKLTKETIT